MTVEISPSVFAKMYLHFHYMLHWFETQFHHQTFWGNSFTFFRNALTAAAAAGQVYREENTGARHAVLLRACTHVPGASEDSGSGQGFLFHSRPQWIHHLGRYLARRSYWRTGPSLVSVCPQSHSNTNKLAHKVPLRASRLVWVCGGENTAQCFPPSLDVLS